MLGGSEHQYPPENVFVDNVVLDVIGVVLHAERQQLQDQSKQLACLKIICGDLKAVKEPVKRLPSHC